MRCTQSGHRLHTKGSYALESHPLSPDTRSLTSSLRYWEGRRLWSQLVINARCFSRTIWVHVPDIQQVSTPSTALLAPEDEARGKLEDHQHKMMVAAEKRTMMGLTLAFAVAVKHCESPVVREWAWRCLSTSRPPSAADLRGEEGM